MSSLPDIEFDGKTLTIPATLLEQGTTVKVSVANNEYSDWVLDEVDRNKLSDPGAFTAIFKSKSIKDQKYSDGMKVVVEIVPSDASTYDVVKYEFKVSAGKKLKVLNDTRFDLVK